MREIKFRAWDKDAKQMYTHLGLITSNFYYDEIIKIETLMQYTGLKDKSGREIYEGDILKDKFPCIVKFITGCFCLENTFGSTAPIFESNNELIVIGNIYENKELLEK